MRNFTKGDETRFVDSIPVTGDELDMMRLYPECERVGLTNGCDDFRETLTVQDDRARRRVLDRVPIRGIIRSRERVGPLSTCNEVLGRCAERCGKTLHLWQRHVSTPVEFEREACVAHVCFPCQQPLEYAELASNGLDFS